MPEEILNPNEGTGAVVGTQSTALETGVQSGTADQKPAQTPAENAAFADMRRRLEATETRANKIEKDHTVARKYGKEYEVYSEEDISAKFGESHGIKTLEQFEAAIEQEKQRQQYEKSGIDPKAIEKLLEDKLSNNPVIKQTQDYFNKARINEEKAALKDKRFFKELEPEIDKVLAANPQLSAKFVYEYIRGQKLEELIAGEITKAQQKGAEDFVNQSKRGTESSDVPPVDEKTLDFSVDEKSWADRRVKQGTYKNLKEAHDFLRGKAGVKMR
jgi:hypothetical protein